MSRRSKRSAKSKAAAAMDDSDDEGIFDSLVIVLAGSFSSSQAAIKKLITDNGGKAVASVTKAATHVLSTEESVKKGNAKLTKASALGLPVLSEDWLHDSVSKSKMQPAKKYDLSSAMVIDDDDDDDDDDKKTKKKSARGTKRKTAAAKSSRGKKKSAAAADDDDDDDDDDDSGSAKRQKSASGSKSGTKSGKSGHVKMVRKGRAAVDIQAPGHQNYRVFEEGDTVWDAMLNQTNIANNNNKYYIVQLLQHESNPNLYSTWTRWGRVGKTAGQAMVAQSTTLDNAKRAFCKKFTDKTKNQWANRHNFQSFPGKYTLLERDYMAENEKSGGIAGGGDDDDEDDDEKRAVPDSKLSPEVQSLVSLISDTKMFKEQMVEIGYDANKLPLGKLTPQHIQRGYSVLKKISVAIEGRKSHSVLTELSNEFYTLIPHDFGMSRPPVISTKEQLKKSLELVESLADIELATKLLQGGSKVDEHPIDTAYRQLKCDMEYVEPKHATWKMVNKYLQNTHASTHSQYKLKLLDLYTVEREGEADRYAPYADMDNRMLLWHGSRLTNFMGILSQGLRIAPPEAPVTGYMFGKGVYFADMSSKSANYCRTTRSSPTGILLLCEVAIGKPNKLLHADYNANKLPKGTHSTWGMGKTHPDPSATQVDEDGVTVPLGKGVPSGVSNTSLLYNEFIVYDVAQIKVRYLLKVKFEYGKSSWY